MVRPQAKASSNALATGTNNNKRPRDEGTDRPAPRQALVKRDLNAPPASNRRTGKQQMVIAGELQLDDPFDGMASPPSADGTANSGRIVGRPAFASSTATNANDATAAMPTTRSLQQQLSSSQATNSSSGTANSQRTAVRKPAPKTTAPSAAATQPPPPQRKPQLPSVATRGGNRSRIGGPSSAVPSPAISPSRRGGGGIGSKPNSRANTPRRQQPQSQQPPATPPPPPPCAASHRLPVVLQLIADAKAQMARLKAQEHALETAIEQAIESKEQAVSAVKTRSAAAIAALDAEAGQVAAQCRSQQRLCEDVKAATQRAQEATVLAREEQDRYKREERPRLETTAARLASLGTKLARDLSTAKEALEAQQALEAKAKSSTYGLSQDAANLVRRAEVAQQNEVQHQQAAMATEVRRRQLYNIYEDLKGTIRVYCRVRGGPAPPAAVPVTFPDAATKRQCIDILQSRDNVSGTGKKESITGFQFDHVFASHATQQDVFAEVGTMVNSAIDGYKVCIFAFGQTGSGKTHTMEGPPPPPPSGAASSQTAAPSDEDAGVIPRAIEHIFARAAQLAKEGWAYDVNCTFIEIYNDSIRNLLERSQAYHQEALAGRADHKVIHHESGDTVVTGVREVRVKSPQEVKALLEIAKKNRSTARTNMNERSSRSHCVFTMRLDGQNAALGQQSCGALCLIDLAGSERVGDSGATGATLKEAIAINKSLMFLGDCIQALGSTSSSSSSGNGSSSNNNKVVPWRNCQLTYLLQNYLGGDGSKMLMFVNVSNKAEHIGETLNSLRFAQKVNATSIGSAKKRVLTL